MRLVCSFINFGYNNNKRRTKKLRPKTLDTETKLRYNGYRMRRKTVLKRGCAEPATISYPSSNFMTDKTVSKILIAVGYSAFIAGIYLLCWGK